MKRPSHEAPRAVAGSGLYTADQKLRRDQSKWTTVQGILAPVQFLACVVSIVLIQRWLMTGEGMAAANASVIVKIGLLYAIMITGAIWEKVVFGQYLFAPAFFWEDVVSMLVIALHTAYLVAWWTGALDTRTLFALALVAYFVYVINAVQFLLKLRAARLADRQSNPADASLQAPAGSAP